MSRVRLTAVPGPSAFVKGPVKHGGDRRAGLCPAIPLVQRLQDAAHSPDA